MEVERLSWATGSGNEVLDLNQSAPDVIIYFGSTQSLSSDNVYEKLEQKWPDTIILGCSTGGQIFAQDVVDDGIFAVAMSFESTQVRLVSQTVSSSADSRACGVSLGEQLKAPDLSGVFVLSDGLNVNGSALVAGLTEMLGANVPLTGGLAGDADQFEQTLVGANAPPKSHVVAALGFYGSALKMGHGCAGGWDVFGPWRTITRAEGNVLYELDGEPALDLYEHYLGEEAKGLPGSGLLFPLQIQNPENAEHLVVRTILAIDREARSLTFAGDVPVGWGAQLMHGNFESLSDGAADAARQATRDFPAMNPSNSLALMVSCIGRRLLMGQRITEEIDAVNEVLGSQHTQLGFYSYGEISPHAVSNICELHNQTMAITILTETTA